MGFLGILVIPSLGDSPQRTLFSADQAAASALNFQIVDTKDGTPIAADASEEVLKVRFVPKKK